MVNNRKKDLVKLAFILAGILLLNFVASLFFTRFDFTAEKRYTLSPITKNILAGLQDQVQITVYLEGEFPAGFKRLRSATNDLLRDFDSYAGGKLQFDFVQKNLYALKKQKIKSIEFSLLVLFFL